MNHRDYARQLRQFIKSAVGKETDEMRRLLIEFFPLFITQTTENICNLVDTWDKTKEVLREVEAYITLHGELRKYHKRREKVIKHLKHVESLFGRVKAQVEHWEKMRVAFNVTLPEIADIDDKLKADSCLYDLFPDLYSTSQSPIGNYGHVSN